MQIQLAGCSLGFTVIFTFRMDGLGVILYYEGFRSFLFAQHPAVLLMDLNSAATEIVNTLVDSIKQSFSFFETERTILDTLNTPDARGETLLYKLEQEANSQIFKLREKILTFKPSQNDTFFSRRSREQLTEFRKLPSMFTSPEFQDWFVSEVQYHMRDRVTELIQNLLASPKVSNMLSVCSYSCSVIIKFH